MKNQDISKSIGGNSSEIHLSIDAEGNLVEFIISHGTTHYVKVAPDSVELGSQEVTEVVCANKVYDYEELRKQIRKSSARTKIPKKGNTKSNDDHMDWYIYKIRHKLENTFARLNFFRELATRFDKLKSNYAGAAALPFIYLITIMKCQQPLIYLYF